MKKVTAVLLVVGVLTATGVAHGKAAFYTKQRLIETAEIIAIVDISVVSETATQGESWTYGQAASASTVKILKGKVADKFTIHAEKNFICARASYESGRRYLVFLRREGKLYTTINHHLGQFEIADESAKWFAGTRTLSINDQPLDKVLQEIRQLDIPIEHRIASLSSEDGNERVTATRAIFHR
jgi:hypothetical protein